MPFNDKGETLLQRLIPIFICLISLYSCVTDIGSPESNNRAIDPLKYFESSSINDWLKGIEAVEETISSKSYLQVFEIYLNDNYEVIRGNLKLILSLYINNHDIDFSTLLNNIDSSRSVDLLIDLLRNIDDDKKFSFCSKVYSLESELRLELLESVGKNLLKFSFISDLYDNGSALVKSGILYSSGFLKGDDVLNWLETFLYNNEYDISSAAVFSLSRHNEDGFKILVNNLNRLDSRLKIVTIDLLIFNKYEPLYQEFPKMLQVDDQVIAERIFTSLRNMGDKSTPYILECLKVSLPKFSLNLLQILNNSSDKSYLSKIYYLIYNDNLRNVVIELIYSNNAVSLIQRAVTLETIDISNKFIDYGFNIKSPIIFRNRTLESISLNYFLKNYTLSEISEYFYAINFDSQYIEDYKNLDEIYKALVFMDDFEGNNGEVDFITTYFDISQKEFVAEQDNDAFFNGMETWLESGDVASLNKSLDIKNAGKGDFSIVDTEKSDFFKSLNLESREQINKYEEYKKSIISFYRTTSYRLKFFAEKIINDYGFSYLLG